jgi:hypothetical protein
VIGFKRLGSGSDFYRLFSATLARKSFDADRDLAELEQSNDSEHRDGNR